MTVAKLCGEKWGRLLPVALAAAYCGMLTREFMKSRFAPLIRDYDGRERVDRVELDAMIDEMREEAKREQTKRSQTCKSETE